MKTIIDFYNNIENSNKTVIISIIYCISITITFIIKIAN